MIDVEPLIREELERAVPLGDATRADWDGVLDHAGARRVRSRPLIVLAAVTAALAVLAATPIGGAVVRGFGDFSKWLTGQVGEPAGERDQQAFEEANRRSWAGFPDGVELRSLIRTRAGGREYELFGFRSDESLCLRLVARGLAQGPALSCAPLQELRDAREPALVVLADHSFARRNVLPVPADGAYVAAESSATFGIVADGVRGVELRADDGRHRATVASNTFLYVGAKPKLGTRVRAVYAIGPGGERVRLPFAQAPFGTRDLGKAPDAEPTGPEKVEHVVSGGRVGWLERRERRGEEPNARHLRGPMTRFDFARLLAPDPQSHMRILVGIGTLPRYGIRAGEEAVCVFLVSGGTAGGGCNDLKDPFPRAPFMSSQTLFGGGDQYATLNGLASDDVARMELFLATGERRPIPLRDNAWLIQAARAKYPVRVVAYDADGRVIGVDTLEGGPASAPRDMPQPVAATWRTLFRVTGERGQVARLRVARSSEGGRCFETRLPGGAGGSGCLPKSFQGPKLQLGVSMGARGSWVSGRTHPSVAVLELRFADSRRALVEPVEGFVLWPLPAEHARRGHQLVEAVGRTAAGEEIGRQTFRPDAFPGETNG